MSYTAPVEKLTAGEHSHATSSATSSARPNRPIGVSDWERARIAGSVAAFIGVSTAAGATALTSTPVVASSLPSDFVSAITAAFDAEYALCVGLPSFAAMLARLTMRPQPARDHAGHEGPAQQERAVDVDAERGAPLVEPDVDQRTGRADDAGAVDQDADRAERVAQGVDRGGVGDVELLVGARREVRGDDPDARAARSRAAVAAPIPLAPPVTRAVTEG